MRFDTDKQILRKRDSLKMKYLFIIIIYSTILILMSFNAFYYVFGLLLIIILFEFEWFLIDYNKIIKLSGRYLIKYKEEKQQRKYFDGYYISNNFTHFYIKLGFMKYQLIKSVNNKCLNYFKLCGEANRK